MQHKKVIVYASRQLQKHEESLTTCKPKNQKPQVILKIRKYYLSKLTIHMGHKNLRYIFEQQELKNEEKEILGDYDCDIQYHEGKAEDGQKNYTNNKQKPSKSELETKCY